MLDKKEKPRRRPRTMNTGLRGLQDKYLSGAPLSRKDVMKRDMMMNNRMMDNEPRFEGRSPKDQIFAIEAEIENMMRSYEMAVADGDTDRAQLIADAIDKMEQMKIERQGSIANKMIAKSRPEADFYAGPNMAEGGEAEMPGMSEQEAMAELEGIAPQAQMIEQLIMAVIQMIQQGVSEAEVREFLKEQGLDDEDIEDLFMMVMQQIEQAPAEEPIGKELQGMM